MSRLKRRLFTTVRNCSWLNTGPRSRQMHQTPPLAPLVPGHNAPGNAFIEHASGGVYPNFPDLDLPDWKTAYYGANYERLRQIKSTYDPHRCPQRSTVHLNAANRTAESAASVTGMHAEAAMAGQVITVDLR